MLLENGACEEKGWYYGALHGAIAKKMFAILRLLLEKGASVDSTYIGRTPLCAALTCGPNRKGDVRMVRCLLNAKADIYKKTLGPRNVKQTGKLTHLEVAKKYSTAKCIRLISEKYNVKSLV